MKNSMNKFPSKNKINNNMSNIKKKFTDHQKRITYKLIYDLYKSNFIDNCELILLEKQNIFLDKFFNKMIYVLKGEFSDDIFEKNHSLYEITKKCENNFIKEVYWPMYNACYNAYEQFKKNKNSNNKNNINYLTEFSSHCNYEQIALHSCGSKMLDINSDIDQMFNPYGYVLCTGCIKCFYGNCVQGFCPFVQKQYYLQKIDKKLELNNLIPATWEEYHCKNPIINEQMSCVRCGDLLYIKNKYLFCKKCKLELDPLMIVWTCKICQKDFRSKAKKYNPLEFKEAENAIKEAFLYKIIVKPNELPCQCISNIDLKNIVFYHNKICKGLMYFGKLSKTEFVVCSECKSFYDIKKFLWHCPICKKNFGSKNICLNPKYEDFHFFTKNKNEKNRQLDINLNDKNNNNKNHIYLNFGGTPIRDDRLNLNISNNNMKSYVKKKPEDYYKITNRNRSLEENGLSRSNNKKEKRNLSVAFRHKYLYKNNNDIINNEIDSLEKKDNTKDSNIKYFQTNINFYKTLLNSSKKDINSNKDKNKSFLLDNSNKYLRTEKSQDNNYSKEFLISPKIKKVNRFCSVSSRNINDEDNNDNIISDFNKIKLGNYKNSLNIHNYHVYVPKRKIIINKNKLNLSLINNNNYNKININDDTGYNVQKINTSNSVGIRDKFKKIHNYKSDISMVNQFDSKRNIQTMFDIDEEKENYNYSFLKTQNDFYRNNKITKIDYYNNNKEVNNNIRSSSQIKIERNENYLKNKYNKRYIGSKYNFNYHNINKSNINTNNTKNEENNLYQKRASNLTDNKIIKDISTTNRSNGADSFVLQNQINIDNNRYLLTTSTNKDNISTKENSELKEFNFNDYKIITQLGQGTFGKIYLVQDKNNQLFSMKKIILSEELDVQSVLNEYKMCQKLNHENIVKILGIYSNKLDTTTYVVYILMEVGMTDWEKQITSYADKKMFFSEKSLINIIKQLTTVLAFLQKNNTSHRDIKPQNILVFKNDIYKLADFGEAKQIEGMKNLIVNYSLRGTELYMSPLLFNGLRNGQIDIKHNLFKSDVYSLGLCILFAALTKNKPLYEIRKYIDMKGVRRYLEKILKGKYSNKFIGLICSMLEIHEKNRPDFIELDAIMKRWK